MIGIVRKDARKQTVNKWIEWANRKRSMLKKRLNTGKQEMETTVTATDILDMLKSQNYKCALTQIDLSPKNAAVDHKLPVCKGGTNHIDNLQILHKDVNRAKGSLTMSEFIKMCRAVATNTADHVVCDDAILDSV